MKHVIFVFLFIAFASVATAQTLNDLTWVTEEYPPYNFTEKGIHKGIAVDVLLEVWKRVGIQKTERDITVYPWARAVNTMEKTKGCCLFSTTITPKRKNSLGYKFISPIPGKDESGNHIIALKTAHIKIASQDDLKKFRIGVVLDDVGEDLVTDAKVPKDHIVTCNNGGQLVNMMDKKRFDVMSYEFLTAKDLMKDNKIDSDQYEIVFTFLPLKMGYAFNKDTDPALIKELQKALDSIYADGTAEKIKKRYMGN